MELTRPDNKEQPTLGRLRRFPWIISFSFGLLHGLGFASALKEAGLQQTSIPLALACFNVGVEIGQLIFLSILLTLLKICSKIAFFQKRVYSGKYRYTSWGLWLHSGLFSGFTSSFTKSDMAKTPLISSQ